MTDLLNIGSELQQHVALFGLLQYIETKSALLTSTSTSTSPREINTQNQQQNGYLHLPKLRDENDAKLVVEYAKQLLKQQVIAIEDFELDEKFCMRYAEFAAVEVGHC